MADTRTVRDRVVDVVCSNLGVTAQECKDEAIVKEDLNADSLDVVDLVMDIEEEFGIAVEDDDMADLKTVGDIVAYVERKIG